MARRTFSLRLLFCMVMIGLVTVIAVQQSVAGGTGAKNAGETYVPGIWIDPDGCEHWVMDDGIKGYMSPHLTRDGRPVCHKQQTCAVLNSDQLFASGSAAISPGGRKRLLRFFKSAPAQAFIINGYTDSRGPAASNQRLSQRRANAVAGLAARAGVRIFDARGYGENYPKASNSTRAGRAENRRVELICVY